MTKGTSFLLMLLLSAIAINADDIEKDPNNNNISIKNNALTSRSDLDTSATSAKLFNLGSLFGQNPNYPQYGYGGYYPQGTYNRPYYPSTGYYPNTGWTGGNYYPNYGYGGGSGYYPNTGAYYPTTGGYYPSTGTNILGGNGGYGGYGGNGGLRQYNGYWNPDYTGQRNRGFGYFADTDRYGLPRRGNNRGGYDYDGYGYGRERDRVSSGGYRGYQ